MSFLRWTAVLMLAVAVFPVGSAFTAGNTGEGASAISGYRISQLRFVAAASDPTRIAAVSFVLAPAAASTVRVRLSAGGAWYPCVSNAGHAVCTTAPQPPVASTTALEVVAFR
jgi:hypothetical protein